MQGQANGDWQTAALMEELLETVGRQSWQSFVYEAAEQPLQGGAGWGARGKTNVCLVVGSEGAFLQRRRPRLPRLAQCPFPWDPEFYGGDYRHCPHSCRGLEMGC